MKFKIFSLLILLFLFLDSAAQEELNIDSLKQVTLNLDVPDTTKVRAYGAIIGHYRNINPDIAAILRTQPEFVGLNHRELPACTAHMAKSHGGTDRF